MPTTIRTSDPRELLALIPFQLGFQPEESAVVLSVRGDRRIGLVARVDLRDLAEPGLGAQLARNLVSHLTADGAQRAVVALYTAENLQDAARSGGVGDAAVAHLNEAADHVLGAPDCWVVGADGYYGLGCLDPACCPPGGRPLDDLQGTRVGAQMVLDGVQVAASREHLGRITPASATARKSARRARARWAGRMATATGTAEAHRWRREGLELWRAEVARMEGARAGQGDLGPDGVQPIRYGSPSDSPPAPTVAGRLLAALDDVLVRDAVLLSFVPGEGPVADRLVAGDGGAEVGRALGAIVDPVAGIPPARIVTATARTLLEHLVAHSPRHGQAPALTLLAVLAWWEGDGARAGVLADRALVSDPGHRLAVLVDDALRLGMPPGWARART